jgi:uncharacterized protein YcbK (DUF882 family)
MPLPPSDHLTWVELECKDGTPYPEIWRNTRLPFLTFAFEKVRALYGKPITVVSAYRTESHNRSIGGARFSQHVQGRALDLKPPKGVTVEKFFNDIKAKAKEFGIHGIGKYKTFVHIDVRPEDRLAVWNGKGVKDSASNG